MKNLIWKECDESRLNDGSMIVIGIETNDYTLEIRKPIFNKTKTYEVDIALKKSDYVLDRTSITCQELHNESKGYNLLFNNKSNLKKFIKNLNLPSLPWHWRI